MCISCRLVRFRFIRPALIIVTMGKSNNGQPLTEQPIVIRLISESSPVHIIDDTGKPKERPKTSSFLGDLIAGLIGIAIAGVIGLVLIYFLPSNADFVKSWPVVVAVILGLLKAIKDFLDSGMEKAESIRSRKIPYARFYAWLYIAVYCAYNVFMLVALYVVAMFAIHGITLESGIE